MNPDARRDLYRAQRRYHRLRGLVILGCWLLMVAVVLLAMWAAS